MQQQEERDQIISKLQEKICSECGKSKCINNYGSPANSWYNDEYLWNIHMRFGEKGWPKCGSCLCNYNDICVKCCLSVSESPLLLTVNSTPREKIVLTEDGLICSICSSTEHEQKN